MRKLYSKLPSCRIAKFIFTLMLLAAHAVNGQTTITTLPNPPYNGGNSLGGPSNISFAVNNTNPFGINITSISNWCNTTENGSVW